MKHKSIVPLVSIIIPLHVICRRFFEDLEKFRLIKYPRYEIIIVSDVHIPLPKNKRIRLCITGKKFTGPAEKRDFGAKIAKGEISAFIDDDAYPDPHWITRAIRHMIKSKHVVAVGGPGITSPDDVRMAKLGGLVYESDYTSGGLKMRFTSEGKKIQHIVDWPAYNLFFRKSIMKKVGGWGNTYYGGEDTYICLKILPLGTMIYDPKVIVYHHRRPLFIPHLKQIFNVGKHRGYFFKRYPETSRQWFYLLPMSLTIGFWLFFLLSLIHQTIAIVFLLLFIIFFAMAFSTVYRKTDILGACIASIGIIMTHMAYGSGFIIGLCTKNLIR